MSTGGKKPDRLPQQPPASRPKQTAVGPSRPVRILASMVLLWHVFILFLYPLANSRTSETVTNIARSPLVRWYADPLYLNQGYGFFGPDPGPGFLIEYKVFGAGGDVIAEGKFPDAERLWPRLRYHRYKMLADQMDLPGYHPERPRYVLERYARHLIRQYNGERAEVQEVLHELVTFREWRGDGSEGASRMLIDDKSKYKTLLSVSQTRADIERAEAEEAARRKKQSDTAPEAISPGGAE